MGFTNGGKVLCLWASQVQGQTCFSSQIAFKDIFPDVITAQVWAFVSMQWYVPLMCVLHQLRQVSQAKRWDDVGTGRRNIRQSRIVESLEFADEDFGVNLGIVSVRDTRWPHVHT